MRYLWDETGEYFRFGRGRRWKQLALRLCAPSLRRFDRRSALLVDHFIANSRHVRARIGRAWDAPATVIPPPVDTDFFHPSDVPPEDYFLVVSSLEPYKRIELAIGAFNRLDQPLLIAGSGSAERDLRSFANDNVRFLGHVPDDELCTLYQRCRALIFPGVEDFGLVPVEAQACGRPVICYGDGGVTETVIDGETGLHFLPQTTSALIDAVLRLEQRSWDSGCLRRNALKYSADVFRDKMREFLRDRVDLSGGPSLPNVVPPRALLP
jgi:glycosyltransferase involved in cell wall biosynthesis